MGTTMLLRCSAKLRHLVGAGTTSASLRSAPRRILSTLTPPLYRQAVFSPFSTSAIVPHFHSSNTGVNRGTWGVAGGYGCLSSPLPYLQMIVRWKTKVTRARAPDTPVKSKLNKYKIKGYSSYKRRFKPLNDGTIRRWKEGTRHNAHSKSNKAKRRLRKPGLVTLAYAKVMKKLHFFG